MSLILLTVVTNKTVTFRLIFTKFPHILYVDRRTKDISHIYKHYVLRLPNRFLIFRVANQVWIV